MKRRNLIPVALTIVLLLGPTPALAGEVGLDTGGTLTIEPIAANRMLPQAFFDQALASLPQLFPEHVLLASRRAGVLGDVSYALVCYKEAPTSERVVIQAVEVHGDQAWTLETDAPATYGDTLMQVLEQVARLPAGQNRRLE